MGGVPESYNNHNHWNTACHERWQARGRREPEIIQTNSSTAVVNLAKRVNKSEGPVRTAPVWISKVVSEVVHYSSER